MYCKGFADFIMLLPPALNSEFFCNFVIVKSNAILFLACLLKAAPQTHLKAANLAEIFPHVNLK